MKKKFIWLAFAAFLAVALIGCPNGTEDNPGGEEPNPNPNPSGPVTSATAAELEWVQIGTIQEYVGEEKGSVAEVIAAGFDGAAELQLSTSQASGAITYALTASSADATVEFAHVAVAAQASANPTFSAALTGVTFADGDWLLVKVTSKDGSKTNYYRFDITVGRNAKLANVIIGKKPQNTDVYLGTPNETFASVVFGTFQTDHILPSSQFIVTAQDDAATVSYAFDNTGTKPTTEPSTWTAYTTATDWSDFNQLDPSSDIYVMIKVVPTAAPPAGKTLFYAFRLVFPRVGSITYGQPELVDPSDPGSAFYIDPIWDNVDWDFMIDRANMAEGLDLFAEDYYQHTTARAKALWDNEGIWVLVDVDVKAFSKTDGGASVDRKITPGNDHVADSVEIFLNERFQILDTDLAVTAAGAATTNLGNQFRLGVNGARSGAAAAALAAVDTTASDLQPFSGNNNVQYAKFRTVLKTPAGHENTDSQFYATSYDEATNGGYILITHVPFKFTNSAYASEVFDSSGNVIPGNGIGFELQLNCNSGSGRDGILTWNGVNSMSYQNAEGYGVVTLDGVPSGTAKTYPVISAQALSDEQYEIDTTAVNDLSVTSASNTIQWFESDSLFGAGTEITGETSATYKPPVDAEATTYYYAVVTGDGSSVVTNRRAKVEVADASAFVEKWVIENPTLTYGSNTLNADGSVKWTSGIVGMTFPVGNFSSVTFEITTSNNTTDPIKLISKNAKMDYSPDCTTNQYADLDEGTSTLTYPIIDGTGISGNNAALYKGAITWQKNGGSADFDFKVVKVTFTVADADDGSFYVNLRNVATEQSNQWNQWYHLLPNAAFNADGHLTWHFDNDTVAAEGSDEDNPGNPYRQRAFINLSQQAKAKANSKAKWAVEIGGSIGTPTKGSPNFMFFFTKAATESQNWNVSGGDSINDLNGTKNFPGIAGSGNFSAGNLEAICVRQASGSPSGGVIVDLTIQYIKITPID